MQSHELPGPRKLKVLIANDEQMQLFILTMLFKRHEFDITTAINGYEANEYVMKSVH